MTRNIPSKNLLSDFCIDSNGWISCHSRNDTADDDDDDDEDEDDIAISPACQKLLSLLQLKVTTNAHGSVKKEESNSKNCPMKFHSYTSLRSGKSYKIPTPTTSASHCDCNYGTGTGDARDHVPEWDKDDLVDCNNLQDWMQISPNITDLISSILVHIMKMNCRSGRRSRRDDPNTIIINNINNVKGDDGGERNPNMNRNHNWRNQRNHNIKGDHHDDHDNHDSCNNTNKNDEMDNQDSDDHAHGNGDQDIPTNGGNNNDSSERMMWTFHTIYVFLPIAMSMIQHARKHNAADDDHSGVGGGQDGIDDGTNHGKKKMSKRARKQKVYLFFKMAQAYSIVTLGQFKTIKNDVHRLEKIIHGWTCKVSVSHCCPCCPPHDDDDDDDHDHHHHQQQQYHHHQKQQQYHVLVPTIPRLLVYHSTHSTLHSSCHDNLFRQTILQFCNSKKEMKYGRKIDDAVIRPLIVDAHNLHCAYRNSVQILCNRLSRILSRQFKGSHLSVYGSCLSGLSLGHSSDVDLSLYIPAVEKLQERYKKDKTINGVTFQKQMKRFVYRVYDCIQDENHHPFHGNRSNNDNHHVKMEFKDMQAVPFARVPVVKGRYQYAGNPFTKDGSIHFDICILNDIAVANSGLLREYSLLDPRVRMLMLSVKSWIKWKDIGNAAERTLSSYTWMIMVIFYLQCIDFVPNLQCREFMEKHGVVYKDNYNDNDDLTSSRNQMHIINGLKTVYLHHDVVLAKGIWTQPTHLESTPVSALLLGFFMFYARYFSQETTAISIRLGKTSLQKTVFSKSSNLWRMVIEDPFETYDCHIPHDLGTPMDEKGQEKVTKALEEAANTMEEMFASCREIVDCIGSFNIVQKSSFVTNDIVECDKQEVHQQQTYSRGSKIMSGTTNGRNSIPREKEKMVSNMNIRNEKSRKSNNYRERNNGNDKKKYANAISNGARQNIVKKKNNSTGKKDLGYQQGHGKETQRRKENHSSSKTIHEFYEHPIQSNVETVKKGHIPKGYFERVKAAKDEHGKK
jgi:DNA polymerase sigma